MKIQILKCFTIIVFLLSLTGCGAGTAIGINPESSSHTAPPKTIKTKSAGTPQDITEFFLSDESLYEGKPFPYQDQEYQIKEYRIKGTAEEDEDVLYWTLHRVNSKEQIDAENRADSQEQIDAENRADSQEHTQNQNQKIPLVDPQEISLLDSLEQQEFPTKYILNHVFFLSGYLFYSYQECITKPLGKNGAENEWGKAMLCRIHLETMKIDQSYMLVTKEQEKAGNSFQIWSADPDSGFIYLSKKGTLLVLDSSLNEINMTAFDSSEYIMDIYWSEESYVLTDAGIYQMKLALNDPDLFKQPEQICQWPADDSYGMAEVIGIYGNFLYGYTYYFGNVEIAGHYFQIDLHTQTYQTLSADQKKSFCGTYDAEASFDTESFADKHELYSEGRDHSDDNWDSIRVCYILSEDGTVEITTEKTD